MDNQNFESRESAAPTFHERAAFHERVVVIEDQEDIRNLLVSMLEIEDCEALAAANGSDGLELIARTAPDVAIVDIGLPDIDGYEVARRVRSWQDRSAAIKLIALTGYDQPEDVRHALAAGFDHHLVKPFEPARLFELLSECAKSNA